MNLGTLLLIILILLLVGVLPAWPHTQTWFGEYHSYPSIGLGTVIIIVLILWALGVFR